MEDIDDQIKFINSLDVTNNEITFASNVGPCKFLRNESYLIRQAKYQKILENIKYIKSQENHEHNTQTKIEPI